MNEVKTIAAEFCELKTTDDDAMTVEGYGAVFDNVDFGGDLIAKGAFTSTIERHIVAKSMPKMLLQHDGHSLPVGRWETMTETEHGLYLKGRFINTTAGRDTYEAVKEGVVDGLSIGYRPVEFSRRVNPSDPKRTLKSVDLLEVSVVTFPMNALARITAVKSADEIITIRDLEEALRAHGFSKSEARSVCANFESKNEQDALRDLEEKRSLIDAFKSGSLAK